MHAGVTIRVPLTSLLRQARTLVPLMALLCCGAACADWLRVDVPGESAQHRYIDPQTTRQTGPMSIYRQVQELSNYPSRAQKEPGSTWQLSEYDCMQSRVRVLRQSGFVQEWAQGEGVNLPAPQHPLGQWRSLDQHPAGAAVIRLLCPGLQGD